MNARFGLMGQGSSARVRSVWPHMFSSLTMYELSSECFGDPFIICIVSHVLRKVAGLFKALDYDDLPRNENAFIR
jgi:hypothetical protein